MSTHDDKGREGSLGRPANDVERTVQRQLRSLSEVAPDAAFRARMRREFTSGTARGSVRMPRLGSWRTLTLLRYIVPVAAAAAIAVAVMNRSPQWRLQDPGAGAGLTINGKTCAVDPRSGRIRELRGGCRIATSDSTMITLVSQGNLAMQILPGTEMVLPAPPNRWFSRVAMARIETGELHVTTDHGFHGAHLFVGTPELDVEVVGTTVAVMRPDFGTCVCVLEGTVRVAPKGGSFEPVSGGHRFTYIRDGNQIDRGDILPMERTKLGEFRSVCTPEHGMHSHEGSTPE